MAMIRRFPNGFEIHGGRLTKKEEADFYRRIADGPMRILRSKPIFPNTISEAQEISPQVDLEKRRP